MGDVEVVPRGKTAATAATNAPAATGSASDLAVTALILGVAGFAWFGWGRAAPPAGWSIPLAIGSAVGAVLAVAGGVLAWRLRSGASAMHDPQVHRAYSRVVGLEVALIVLGALVLGVTGQSAYLPAWILLVVGVHFIPLARLFRTPGLAAAGLVLIAVAAAAAALGAAGDVLPSAVAGAGGGLVCVTCAVSYLRRAATVAATAKARP